LLRQCRGGRLSSVTGVPGKEDERARIGDRF
jgi:hypothetical protein